MTDSAGINQCGAFERQLLRQKDNPLFPGKARNISSLDLESAREKDRLHQLEVVREFEQLMQEASHLASQVESQILLDLKEKADKLYERFAAMGEEKKPYQQALVRLTEILMKTIRQAAGDDPMAMQQLAMEVEARKMHYEVLSHPLLADMISPAQVIAPEYLVPTLLSETRADLGKMALLFEPAQLQEIVKQATELLDKHAGEEDNLAAAQKNLQILKTLLEESA